MALPWTAGLPPPRPVQEHGEVLVHGVGRVGRVPEGEEVEGGGLTVERLGGRIQLWERPGPTHRIHGIASGCIPQDTQASCERFARQTSTPDGSADCEIGKPGPGF
jgi:hypothetical protein